MKSKIIIVGLVVAVMLNVCLAQEKPQFDVSYTAPIVPVDVFIKGRHDVVENLVGQIDHVILEYTGRSVVGAPSQYFSREDLRSRGYVHKGSFTEFVRALEGIQFSYPVVKTPQGYYDASVIIHSKGVDGRDVIEGSGWLNIQESPEGKIQAGDYQPYVWIPATILIRVGGYIRAAKWLSPDYRDEDLNYSYESDSNGDILSTLIQIPTRILESGHFLVANAQGDVEGVNLETRIPIKGKQLIALLGQIRSSDIVSLKNPSTLSINWSEGENPIRFYKSDGKIYGRFPVIDIATSTGMKEAFTVPIKVWGTDEYIWPNRVLVKKLWVDDPKRFDPPMEQWLPYSRDIGSFIINYPPGGCQIEVKFDEVLDWDKDPNPKG